MARLRRSQPGALRQRMADELVTRYGPPPFGHRHPFDDGLMWEVGVRDRVEELLSGRPVELWVWELPKDVRASFGNSSRLLLTSTDELVVMRDPIPGELFPELDIARRST